MNIGIEKYLDLEHKNLTPGPSPGRRGEKLRI
jgi:hypothetical protein